MVRPLQEFLVGLALVAVSVIALVSISAGAETMFESGRQASMTSKTFPTVLALAMGVLSAIFTISAFMRLLAERREGGAGARALAARMFGREAAIAVAVVALLLAYAWLLKEVHFALLTWVFLFIGFFVFGQRRLLLNAVVAACATAAFYGLFVFVLELPLNP